MGVVEYVWIIISATTIRNAVPASRLCLKTALSRSSRWIDGVPVGAGKGWAPARSPGETDVSWVSNMPPAYCFRETGRATGAIAVIPSPAATDDTAATVLPKKSANHGTL